GALYPASVVGRVIGFLGMGRAAAGALAAFFGGVAADRLGVPTVVIVTGAIGIASALAYAGLRARSDERPQKFSARESIRALRERPVLGRVALAQGFYGGGLIAALPLYALVHVDRLQLSLSEVGVIGILLSAATTVSFPVWGAVSDRFGPLASLRVGSALGIVALVGYAFAPSVAVLWLTAIALGTANASVDVGIGAVVSHQTPLASRAAALAGWNAITGARGIAAAFLMSTALSLGLVTVTTGLLLCAASAAIGVVLFARIVPSSRAVEPAPRMIDESAIAATSLLSEPT
ncbi:MAG TPA: MFS transporter, partial [Candidatus Eisenbacteria bacterium]|nr:MFS transporter [Candidatus Eisenbacteria bacterium]